MSFTTTLNSKCQEYTNMVIGGTRIQLPYHWGGKNLPSVIKANLTATGKSGADLQAWATANPAKAGVDCSGLVYYAINEASNGAVRSYFENALPGEDSLTYAYGISAATLTNTAYGKRITKAKDMTPGCLMRSDNGGHVLVITGVTETRIDYTHSNRSKGPHTGYITIGNPNEDLDAAAQTWHDIAYTDATAKSLYDYTILLECFATVEPVEEIPVSANLTIQGTNVNVRTSPSTSAGIVKTLNTGAAIQANGRVMISGDPWFHIADGWVSGNYVQGWVKDYNDNNRWWYVEKSYTYPKSEWKTIAVKDYCFGPDSYLFVECYIKSEVNNTYYWVDDDGVYLNQYDTTTPDRSYRVVENYKTENAYQG